jgi:hypothetical protein
LYLNSEMNSGVVPRKFDQLSVLLRSDRPLHTVTRTATRPPRATEEPTTTATTVFRYALEGLTGQEGIWRTNQGINLAHVEHKGPNILIDLRGKRFLLQWHFNSDESVNMPIGIMIDNIRLRARRDDWTPVPTYTDTATITPTVPTPTPTDTPTRTNTPLFTDTPTRTPTPRPSFSYLPHALKNHVLTRR